MELVLAFLAGAFITNSVPHIVSGLIGNKHMTPFAKDSSAIVNIGWGYINLVLGAFIFNLSGMNLNDVFSFDNYSIAFMLGSFVIAITAAWLFSNPNARFPWFKK